MNELQIFNHEEFGKVRVVEVNNEPWLVVSRKEQRNETQQQIN